MGRLDQFPYTLSIQLYPLQCVICNKEVDCKESNGVLYPASLYWNVEYKRVFCSAQHSLEYHQNNWR